MGAETKISWCDSTFNPWRGCTRVSPGCYNCYAETLSHRNPAVLGVWGKEGRRVPASEARWAEVFRWEQQAQRDKRRRRVFCGSLCDVFEIGGKDHHVMQTARERLFGCMESFNPGVVYETPTLDWLLLTKRPENIRRVFNVLGLPGWWDVMAENRRNAWLGVSVEDQECAKKRIPTLLEVPAAVRFLSAEPLLRPLDLSQWLKPGMVDWVIVGGESGPDARECQLHWVEEIVDQCKAAGVPVFVKQLGSKPACYAAPLSGPQDAHSLMVHGEYDPEPFYPKYSDPKGADPSEWPPHLRVQEFPTVSTTT